MTNHLSIAVITPALKQLNDQLVRLVDGKLWLQVLIGLFLGLVTGIAIGPGAGLVEVETGVIIGNWLAFPGKLFLASIQMIVIPLVFASIVTGLTGGGSTEQLRTLGVTVGAFFVVSTGIAAAVGIALAIWIKPGSYLSITSDIDVTGETVPVAEKVSLVQQLPEMVVGLIPSNPLNAMVEGQMVQIVLFAFVFGLALLSMAHDKSRPLLELLGALQEVCMSIVRWAMLLAPYAVFGLMAQLTSRTGWQTLIGLSVYVLTVIAGLITLLAAYLLFLRLVSGERPLQFLGKARELMLLAFSTSSSAAVMPLSMKTAVEKFGVRESVAKFVIPLGATVNMNGTALYQAVAAVFLAQVYQIDLNVGAMALIVMSAVGASIGSPATPGVGIVILAGILVSIGVPASGIALIIGVDRLLDMSRTSINVSGDLVAAIFAERILRKKAVDQLV
jgi:Na+/H+-dicarboxylate symporter